MKKDNSIIPGMYSFAPFLLFFLGANKSSGNPKVKYYCNFLIDKACMLFRHVTTNTIKM